MAKRKVGDQVEAPEAGDIVEPQPTGLKQKHIRHLTHEELLARFEALQAEHDALQAKSEMSEQQLAALQNAQTQGALFQTTVQEIPTGKTVKVDRLDKYKITGYGDQGRPILRPTFKKVEVPTFMYKIDMPPCGDVALSINGDRFYHGQVYEFDIDTLRTVKDLVARTWDHERSIHPTDENFYRRDSAWQQRNARAITRGVF